MRFRNPPAPKTVTVEESPTAPDRSTQLGHGLCSCLSAKNHVYLAGLPKVALSTRPGMPPPILSITSLIARPTVAFALFPGPNALPPALTPKAAPSGPDTNP